MYVMNVPVLSTLHITRASAEFLTTRRAREVFSMVAQYDSGWFLFVGSEPSWVDTLENVPADLCAISGWAIACGHEWIRLDGEAGAVIEDLPTYSKEWP